jgi:hypothetical protein
MRELRGGQTLTQRSQSSEHRGHGEKETLASRDASPTNCAMLRSRL